MAYLHIESPRAPRRAGPPPPGEDYALGDAQLSLSFSRVRRLPSLSAKLDEPLRRQRKKSRRQHSGRGGSGGAVAAGNDHECDEAGRALASGGEDEEDSSDDDDFADLFAPESPAVSKHAAAAANSNSNGDDDNDKKSGDGQETVGSNKRSNKNEGNKNTQTRRRGSGSGTKRRRRQATTTKKRFSKVPSGYSGIVVQPTAEQLRKDLNRGSGIVVAQGGGLRTPLNKYGSEVKRRTQRILEVRGRVLGGIVAEQRDLARFLALRDVQMWVIVRRWARQLMRVNLRAWHGLVEQAKEDAERFRKLFIKSDRQRLKKCFKVLRHAADMGMARRANAELNNQSADADKQSQKIRELEGRAKESRHKISSLEYQLDSMKQERDDVKDEVTQLREMLDKAKARELELARMHRENLEAALAASKAGEPPEGVAETTKTITAAASSTKEMASKVGKKQQEKSNVDDAK